MFLLADLSIEVVLGMLFFTLSNVDIKFAQKEFIWRFYTAAAALPTTKRVKIIDKKEFAKVALDEHVEAYIVPVIFLLTIAIYPAKKASIALLIAKRFRFQPNTRILQMLPWKKKLWSY